MKRTCDGCKALDMEKCDLGYKTQKLYKEHSFLIKVKPLEECPKPKTNDEYLYLLRGI